MVMSRTTMGTSVATDGASGYSQTMTIFVLVEKGGPMPSFNSYSDHGVTLMVEFRCRRCGATEIVKLEDCRTNDDYGHLHNLKKPKGWGTFGWSVLLCPKCTAELKTFLDGEREENE